MKIKLFNSQIDDKKDCDVSLFRDGDEIGKNKASMGINSMLTGNNLRGSFYEDQDLEAMLNQEDNMDKEEEIAKKIEFKFYKVVVLKME